MNHVSQSGKPMGKWVSLESNVLLFDEKAEEVLEKQSAFYSGSGNVLELGGSSFKIRLNRKCGYFANKK